MNKDGVASEAKRLKGSVKEAIGKLTGDTRTQAEGAVEKAAGEAESVAGGTKDAIREADKP